MSYAVSLEKFEGPLDLLIHLIQKNKIDIYDIPIAKITNQYLEHITRWRDLDLEVASEFVVMAAKLLEIKSRMLLPRVQEDEENEEDMREKLVRQLIEYKIFKNISVFLGLRENKEQHTFYKDPEYIKEMVEDVEIEIDPDELFKAYGRVFSAYSDEIEFKDYAQEIVREVFTVEEKINFIREQFTSCRTNELRFSELFENKVSKSEVSVTFLALLEMYKINSIRLFQQRVFQEIIIRQRIDE